MSTPRCALRIGGEAGRRFVVTLLRSFITLPLSMANVIMERPTVRSARASTSKAKMSVEYGSYFICGGWR